MLGESQVILSGGTSHTPKIAQLVRNIFSEKTKVLAPSTTTTAINPSELAARGAAIQASLIQEFDKEDIEQSTHPAVTVTPHLKNAIGVEFVAGDHLHFKPLLNSETALPARRVARYSVSKDGGDVLVRICEGVRHIKVTKPEPKPKEEKPAKTEDDEDEDESDFSSEEEDDEIRELVWKTEKPIAELAVKGVKAQGKVEIMVHVNSDLSLQITAREVDGQSAVRGAVEAPKA